MTIDLRSMPATLAACPRLPAHELAVGGLVLATIRGTAGTMVLAGRNSLLVCGCSLVDAAPVPNAAVWTYDRVVQLSVQRAGVLEILGLTICGGSDVLPLIALDHDGVAAALVAIQRVRYLIDADRSARAVIAVAEANSAAAPRRAVVMTTAARDS